MDKIKLAYIANRRKEINALCAGDDVQFRYHAALAHRAIALACSALGEIDGVIAVMDWEMEVVS